MRRPAAGLRFHAESAHSTHGHGRLPGERADRRGGREGDADPEDRPTGPGGGVASEDPVRVGEEAHDDQAATRKRADGPDPSDDDGSPGSQPSSGRQPDDHQCRADDDRRPDRADPRYRHDEEDVPRVE